MRIVRTQKALKRLLAASMTRHTTGFVPTMGFLHEGHLGLVRQSKKENDRTVVSLFVNPLQFGPGEDLDRYPRHFSRDKKILESAGADVLFVPDEKDFYPDDFQTSVKVGRLSLPLCGVRRPTHFSGVATVVLKLLNFVSPDCLYLGQKDFQQCRVIEQLVKDMGLSVRVRRVPIVREPDGLAMSSRNVHLLPEERTQASVLHQSLLKARQMICTGRFSPKRVKQEIVRMISKASRARIDYAEIVSARTLEDVVKFSNKPMDVLVALAVYFSKTRLIDNELIHLR